MNSDNSVIHPRNNRHHLTVFEPFHDFFYLYIFHVSQELIEFVDSKESDPTASEDAVKRKPGKSSKSDDKKAGQKRDKEQGKEQGKDEKKSQDASGETDSSSDEDIWATEDEDCYEENDSDSSQDEYNRGPSVGKTSSKRQPSPSFKTIHINSPACDSFDGGSTEVEIGIGG